MKPNEISTIVAEIVKALEKRGMIKPEPKLPAADKRDDGALANLMRLLESSGGKISRAELLYRTHLRDREFNRALAVLAERGEIIVASETIRIGGRKS